MCELAADDYPPVRQDTHGQNAAVRTLARIERSIDTAVGQQPGNEMAGKRVDISEFAGH